VSDLRIILRARLRALLNSIKTIRQQSRLKIAFITIFAVAFWAGLFLGFRDAFFYIYKAPGFENLLVGIVFNVFFLSLLIMLVFSNAVLIYSSLYRSSEVEFLLSLPVKESSVFLYKYVETLVYSSWAFAYLAVPIILAFGYTATLGVPWYFYPAAMLMFAVFVAIPAAAGSLISMLLVTIVPRSRIKVLMTVGGMLLLAAVLISIKYVSGFTPRFAGGYSEIGKVVGKVAFAQNPFLPSAWLSKGVIFLSRSEPREAFFYLLVILANSLFMTAVAQATSRGILWRSFSKSHSSASRRTHVKAEILTWLVHKAFFFMPLEIRLFLAKDLKTFFRDITQWLQFVMFFGVLAIYILNIRTLPYDWGADRARNSVSLLNLAATCLVLSTFTGRFIFPLLSLEGKKFWVLGLAPIKRRQILLGKFFFAFFGSLAVSEALILLSDLMLDFPLTMWLGHAVLVLAICSGLSAISVGLGARYPNLKEDNPSKIVAGFGGTLNLIVSMLYIAIMVAFIGLPYHVAFSNRLADSLFYYRTIVGYLGLSLLVGAVVSVFFLNLGRTKFEQMEF